MKKLILLLAMLSMLVVAALPAIGQISQDTEQEAESGDLDQSSVTTQTGDNSVQCVGSQQVGNTGNAQSSLSILQYGSDAGELEAEDVGSAIDVSPSNSTECDGSVNQLANAQG